MGSFPIDTEIGEVGLFPFDVNQLVLLLRYSEVAFFVDIGLKRGEGGGQDPYPDIKLFVIQLLDERVCLYLLFRVLVLVANPNVFNIFLNHPHPVVVKLDIL